MAAKALGKEEELQFGCVFLPSIPSFTAQIREAAAYESEFSCNNL